MPNGDAEKKRKGAASLWEKFRQRYPSLERFGDAPWNSEGVFPQAVVDAAKKARWEKNLPSPVRQEPLRADPIATPRADPSTGMPDLARNIPVRRTSVRQPFEPSPRQPNLLEKGLGAVSAPFEAFHQSLTIPMVSEFSKYLPYKWEAPQGISPWEGATPPTDPRTGMPDLASGSVDTGIFRNLQRTADAYRTPEGEYVTQAVMKSPFAMFNPLTSAMPGGLPESLSQAPFKEALNIPTPWEAETIMGKRIKTESDLREEATGEPMSVREQRKYREELYKLPPGVRATLEELPYFAVPPMAAVRKPLQVARIGLESSRKFGRATPAATGAMKAAEMGLKPLQMTEELAGAGFRLGARGALGASKKVLGVPTKPPTGFEPVTPKELQVGISPALTDLQVDRPWFTEESRRLRKEAEELMQSGNPADYVKGEKIYRDVVEKPRQYLENTLKMKGHGDVVAESNFGYFGGMEPSFNLRAKPANPDKFIRDVIDIADIDFGQTSVLIHSPVVRKTLYGFFRGKGNTPDYSIEPMVAMRTVSPITGKQWTEIQGLMEEVGLPGFSSHADGKGLDIIHVSKYSYDVSAGKTAVVPKAVPSPTPDDLGLVKEGRYYYPKDRFGGADLSDSPIHKVTIGGRERYLSSSDDSSLGKIWYEYKDKDSWKDSLRANHPMAEGRVKGPTGYTKRELIEKLEAEAAALPEAVPATVADTAIKNFEDNVIVFKGRIETNENLRGLRPAYEGSTRRLLHYGEGEDWWWLKEGDSVKLAVKSNTADPRHGYDAYRRYHDPKTTQASETTGLTPEQKKNLALRRWGSTQPPPTIPTATAGIQSLVDDVLTTSPNLPENRGAAQNKVLEKITQLVSGDDTAILGKEASLYNYISKQTGRSVEDLKKLVRESEAEFRQQAGQVSPAEASMNKVERRVRDSLGTYGRILRETSIGGDVSADLIKTFEGQMKQLFADASKLAIDGGEKLHDLNVVSGRGFFSRGLHLPRNQRDIDQLDLLHEALNNPSKVETGEIPIPEKFREVYDDLRTLTGKEETSRLDFDPNMATVEDYWYRGWKVPKDLANQSFQTPTGMLGDVPSFMKQRSPKTYRELRDLGFEPLYWNPYDQWLHSRQMGIRHRLQTQLIRDLKRTNPGDIYRAELSPMRKKATALIRSGDPKKRAEGNRILKEIKDFEKRSRVPEVGPAFEGKPGRMAEWKVTNELADRLENVFGKTPVIKVKVPIANRYVDLYPVISVATFGLKRSKLFGSLFQQRDFLGRSWGGAWTGALHELERGKPIEAVKSILRWPKAAYEILESNFSPGSRDRLKAWYRSTETLVEGRPGINPAALVKAGLSSIDVTLLPTINNAIPRMVAAEAGLLGNKKAMKLVGDIESAMRRGLFEGVYAAAIKTDIVNNIAKQVAREYPHYTDDQINRAIAEIANIKYSTIPASQSVVQNRVFRHILTHSLFSMGEAEGLLRQGTQAFRGAHASYWRRHWVAAYLNMLATAEVIHYLSTMEWNNGVPDITSGKHLPLARMVPFEVVQGWTPGDIFSEQVGPVMYNSLFVSPDIPFRDRSGERLKLDLMGQLDTVFKLVDPVTWIDSRFSVPISAGKTQITGRDFYGRTIDNIDLGPIHGLTSRTIQLIHDVAVPIGTGQAILQTGRELLPATEELIPQEEARVGMAGQWVQGPFGLNVKAQTTGQLNNMMVQRAVEADPEEAQRLGLEAGMEYKGLSIQNKNWVDEMPANQQLLEERGLRREEAVATTGEQEWWTAKRVRTEELAQDLIGYAEEAQGKVSPYAWYRLKAEVRVSDHYDREAVLLAKGKKDFGDDFMEGIAPSDPSPDYLLEQDYFGLLFDDDTDVYEKYFPDKEHVPLEDKDGRFNVLEYRKRTEALNQAAGDPDFVKNKKDALLQRRAREYNLPDIEVERLRDRVYVAENYWNLDTSDRVLELFPSDEVRQAWIKYSVMDEADKREADEVGRYASLKHRIGGSLKGYTFKELSNSAGLRTLKYNKRRNDPKLEEILMKWGYLTTPIEDVGGGIRSRVQETGRGIPTYGMGVK